MALYSRGWGSTYIFYPSLILWIMAQFLIFFYCFFPPFLLPMKKSALQFFLSARLGAKKVSSIQAWLILLHFFVISMNGAWYNVFWLWKQKCWGKCSLKKMIVRVWLVFFSFCLKMHLLRHVRVVPLDTHFIFFWKFTSFWELGSGLDLIRHICVDSKIFFYVYFV